MSGGAPGTPDSGSASGPESGAGSGARTGSGSGGAGSGDLPFWERPEMVERFAARDPDHRLVALIDTFANPPGVRALDLGCAAGRNTVLLARRGFDVIARDASRAMVEATRGRVAEILGAEEAGRRVRLGSMDRLEGIADGSMDLVVALGVLHEAHSEAEWERALGELRRVAATGAWLLVAEFTDAFDPEGTGLPRVAGERHIYEGVGSGRAHLVDAPTLDRELGEFGFTPWVPTETVRRATDAGGWRVTANALYRKA